METAEVPGGSAWIHQDNYIPCWQIGFFFYFYAIWCLLMSHASLFKSSKKSSWVIKKFCTPGKAGHPALI